LAKGVPAQYRAGMSVGADGRRQPEIVGRDAHVAAVRSFVAETQLGPAALFLEGEPGIGKTTLWRDGVDAAEAAGSLVLRSRPSAAEAQLTFAGLTDLLGGVLDTSEAQLPEPQRVGLEVALLRRQGDAEAGSPEPRTVATGLLTVLRALASRTPVLLAIDDLQWFDASTTRVLTFALRRLETEPVRLLASLRRDPESAQVAEDWAGVLPASETINVGPLSLDEIRGLLRGRLAAAFSRPTQRQIHEASGGNPFFALEIGRALLRGGEEPRPGEPLPVPRALRDLVQARVAALSDDALQAALIASATARPTRAVVAQVIGEQGRASRAIEEAQRADVLEDRAGTLSFTHPLLASTVYAAVPAEQRRRLHRRLAEVAVDAEDQARHLALSTDGPDPRVVEALTAAAHEAARRGATDGAARLLEQALAVAPDQDVAARVTVLLAAAAAHSHAGGYLRARELLAEAARMEPSGPARARVLYQLAEATYTTDGPRAAEAIHHEALEQASGDVRLQVFILKQLAWYALARASRADAEAHATEAVRLAETLGDPLVLLAALDASGDVRFRYGDPQARAQLERALELERQNAAALGELIDSERPSQTLVGHLVWEHRFAEARPRLLEWHDDMLAAGEEGERCAALWLLAHVECWSGELGLARRYAEEAYEVILGAERIGELATKALARGLVYAHLGLEPEAREMVAEALRRARETGSWYTEIRALSVLGFLELSLGRHEAAREPLGEAVARILESGWGQPAYFGSTMPDAVEALLTGGDLERAEQLVEWLEERARTLDHHWALATSARVRGLLHAAQGDTGTALATLLDAVAIAEQLGEPVELGRTLLALGTVQRRANQRKVARESLERAVGVFETLGSRLWAERAREELGRVSGRPRASQGLTETEARVAALVAQGLSNREVADRLFVTPRTVEANLTRIFGKLGVRSRSELAARHLSETTAPRI
jgi:DNA-binding CsgD family transcriptional regulator